MKTVSDTISRLAHFIMSLEFQQRYLSFGSNDGVED